jgi:uncharacterized cupin superfamily protein
MTEARLDDGKPLTAGWFVVNARDGHWMHNDMRAVCRFSGEGEARFDALGIGLYWLEPGKLMAMYHEEPGQEDFLVLRGRCLLIVEGRERPLETWDFVHCPPGTPHTIVGAGHEPSLVLAVGARTEPGTARYTVDEAAVRNGAGVTLATASPSEAYAGFNEPRPGSAPEIFDESQRI